MKQQMKRTGFTLIELLVVISIIAILAAILVPAVAVVRVRAKMAADRANVGGIAKALVLFSEDANGLFPNNGSRVKNPSGTVVTITLAKQSMKALVWAGTVNDPKMFNCPGMEKMQDADLQATIDKTVATVYNDYYYTFGPSIALRSDTELTFCISDPPEAWASTSKPFVVVAKCDGTTTDVNCESWHSGTDITSNATHPYRAGDKIFQASAVTDGVDTYLTKASD